jgi:riboflavin kinase/FMN adenylyltransferase
VPLRELWVGEGFAMGRERTGDVPSLMAIGRDLGFAVGAVSEVRNSTTRVSASLVRERLDAGDVTGAQALLGRSFALRGTVVEGDKRGRTIGFPTANMQIDPLQIVPADGVYACRAFLADGSAYLPAVTNIGVRPTFDGLRRTVEAHLLDWSGDLYGQVVRLTFEQRLRGEQKFASIDDLVAQIRRDADAARTLLR